VIAVTANSSGALVAGRIIGLAFLGVGIWAYFGKKRRVWLTAVVVVFFAASAILAWIDQFHLAQRAPSVTYADVVPIANVAVAIALLIVMRFRPSGPLCSFSTYSPNCYWASHPSIGTMAGRPISRSP
jgi:hypothetical protein